MKSVTILFTAATLLASAASTLAARSRPTYPPTPRDTTVDTYFGTRVPAPYQWMENLQDPRLAPWIAAQNEVTNGYLSKLPLRAAFYANLRRLSNYPKESTPVQRGPWLFYTRNTGLQNQGVVFVRRDPAGKPRMLLDPNVLSHHGGIALAAWVPSPNGRYLAYALSVGGSDWETVHVMDVATGAVLPHAVQWVKFSGLSWTHDNRGFFYSRYPQPPKGNAIAVRLTDQALYYHGITDPQAQDRLIYRRSDRPQWIIDGQVSPNGRYLFIDFQFRITSNDLYYVDLGDSTQPHLNAPVRPLFTHDDAQYSPIGTRNDTVFLQTDLNAPRGRVIAVTLHDQAHIRTVVPQMANAVIDSSYFADGRILVLRSQVDESRLALYSTSGAFLRSIPLPEATGTVGSVSARERSPQIYFGFTSFLRPAEVLSYDIPTDRERLLFKPHVAFDPSHYVVKQTFYRSTGDVKVPMFVVHRRGLARDGRRPTALYGYGGFDITVPPYFSPAIATWLRMGGVFAMPNLRGGGVYGQAWHHAGMLQHKQNVFDDFANAAHWLIRNHYTSSPHLAIMGYSNGGLLTGASVTEHPHLFGAVYIGHGVLDMLRFQQFSGGEYWIAEYGTSAKAKDFQWLNAYSPLQNLRKGVCYPPTIITTSTDDDRVVPSNAYKFAAQMQHDQGCSNPILLHVATATSHIYMPLRKQLRHDADNWAFLGSAIGLNADRQPGGGSAQ